MERNRIVINRLVQLALGAFIVYVTATCSFTPEGVKPGVNFYNCTTEVSNCGKKSEALDVLIEGDPQYPNIKKYQKTFNLWGDKSKTYSLYFDYSFNIANVELPEIKGSLLIQPSYYDKDIYEQNFLKITLLNDIANFYIAYDQRVNPKPDWLTNEYEPEVYPIDFPYYIATNRIRYEIWRKKTIPQKGAVVYIPSNIYNCKGCLGKDPNMYVVIIKPKETIDCTNKYDFGRKALEGCFDKLEQANEEAQNFCKKNYPTYQCRDTFCQSITACSKTDSLRIDPTAFSYGSEIEFNPSKYKSVANIKIKGNQFNNRAVKGTLHFEYQHQNHHMKLNSMTLHLDPLQTEIGDFRDVTVALWKSSGAQCKDTMAIYDQPCNNYGIAQGDFIVGLGARFKGKILLFTGTNQNPLVITIDHKKKTFNFQGSLHTLVEVDGENTPLDISINLTGRFVNFAPKAVGSESTKSVECGIRKTEGALKSGNNYPVKLDSAGSFDIYDEIPTNPANYEWYEDFGLVTEKLWWKGPKHIIAPYNLGLGVHTITLLVKDKNGIVDTDTFNVEVRDTIPPELTIPHDIVRFFHPNKEKEPFKVNIGKASAYDTCSEKVMVSNDAPTDMLFPAGATTVTWKAADGGGNVTTKVQKVYIIPFKESVIDLIQDSSVHLVATTNKSMNAMEECKANPTCISDIEPVISAFEQFIGHIKEGHVTEDKAPFRQQVIGKLETALASLKEADDLSKRSNRMEKRERIKLRNSALDKLQNARDLMAEITDISRAIK